MGASGSGLAVVGAAFFIVPLAFIVMVAWRRIREHPLRNYVLPTKRALARGGAEGTWSAV